MKPHNPSQRLPRLVVLSLLIAAGTGSLLSLGPQARSARGLPQTPSPEENSARAAQFVFQRSYPFDSIPPDARREAWDSRPRDWLQTAEAGAATPTGWRSIGPRPTAYIPNTVGSVSGRIEAIAISPANPQLILIGGSVGGIWRSTDGGGTFTPVADDQADIAVGGIAFSRSDPSVVYAGMGNQYLFFAAGSGVLKSTDAGATWRRVSNATLPVGQTSRIEVDPTDAAHVYLAQAGLVTGSGLFTESGFNFSTDGGINWTKTLSGDARALLVHPTRPHELYLSMTFIYDIGRDPGLYKSTDGGVTWSLILGSPYPSNMLRTIQPAISAASPDRVYAVVNGEVVVSGVFGGAADIRSMVSADAGRTWTNNGMAGLVYGFETLFLAADPVNADVVYAGGADLYKSTDGGLSYTSLNHGYSPGGPYTVHVDMHSFAFAPPNHNEFYVGSDGGLWRGTSGGASFQNLNSTLSLTMFVGVAVHPTDPSLVFGGTQDNGFQKRRGTTLAWDQLPDGGDDGQTVFNPIVPSMVFHAGAEADIYRRLNNGDTFDRLCGPGYPSAEAEPDGRNRAYLPFVGNGTDATLYLGTWRLWVSRDLCDTWSTPAGEFDLTKGSFDAVSAIGVSRSNPNVVYTGSVQGRAMVSVSGGVSWTDISAGLPNRYISSITVDPTNPAVAFLTVAGYRSGHIFKTTNTGTLWVDISGNLPDIPTNAFLIDPLDPGIIYAGTDIGVFLSPSGGRTWYTFNSGMPPAVVTGFGAQASGLIRLATYGRGMYELVTPPPPTPRAPRKPRVVPAR